MPSTVLATFSVLKNHLKLKVNPDYVSIDNISKYDTCKMKNMNNFFFTLHKSARKVGQYHLSLLSGH